MGRYIAVFKMSSNLLSSFKISLVFYLIAQILSGEATSCWNPVGSPLDGENAGDNFGVSVSLSGNGQRLAVGAYNNDNSGPDAGQVRVYSRTPPELDWSQLGDEINGQNAGDVFGRSTSLSNDGSTLAIGADNHDVGLLDNSGQVRVYTLSESNVWKQTGIPIDGVGSGDFTGFSVALNNNGSIIIVGSPRTGPGGTTGSARAYRLNLTVSDNYEQLGLPIEGTQTEEFCGQRVAINGEGTRIAIASPLYGVSRGRVRIYELVENTRWLQMGEQILGNASADTFGNGLSFSDDGSTVAIGAYRNDNGGNDAGHTQIYRFDSGSDKWVKIGQDINGENEGDNSGYSVSLNADGTVVAIGAWTNDGGLVGDFDFKAGHVRVYKFNETDNQWTQVAQDIDGTEKSGSFGNSVSISDDGNTVAIGALGSQGVCNNKDLVGQVRVFQLENDTNFCQNGSGFCQNDSSYASIPLHVLVLAILGVYMLL